VSWVTRVDERNREPNGGSPPYPQENPYAANEGGGTGCSRTGEHRRSGVATVEPVATVTLVLVTTDVVRSRSESMAPRRAGVLPSRHVTPAELDAFDLTDPLRTAAKSYRAMTGP